MLRHFRLLAMLIALFVCRAAAQSNPPEQVQVSPDISQGLLIYKVQPIYPPLARQARVQGTVVLQAVIGKDGSIKDLTVTSGHPMLTQAALDAVKRWRYKPYYLNGEPVLVGTTINVNFQLSNGPAEAQPNQPALGSTAGSEKPNPPQAEGDALKPYTTCDLGSDFQIVQVDGPVKDFAWPTPTKNGEVRIPVDVGYRVLITYMVEEPFGNLKVERLPKSQYSDEKTTLLQSLEYMAADPGMERNIQTATRNGLTLHGTTRDKLEGGTLSIYYLFLDDEHVLVSMYLLNAEPRWRLFNTLEEYKKVRDHFVDVYTKCVATVHESRVAKVGAPAEAQPNQPAAKSGNVAGQTGSSSPAGAANEDTNALYANASSAIRGNDCATAIPLATRLTEIRPQHGDAWNLLGLCYLELDELQKAEDSFKRQIAIYPQSAFAYNNLGRTYARERNFEMADAQFRKQLELNPRDRYVHMNLAASLHSQQKCDQAVPEFQLAVELTPENAGAHAGLAQCYLDQGKQESGIAELDKAAALTSSGPGWNSLAWIMAEHRVRLERAEQYARLAVSMETTALTLVSLDPLTPGAFGRTRALTAAWDTLGWILFLRGDLASAEKYLQAAWALSQNPTISDHLAQLYEKLGRREEAMGYSALAVAGGERFSEARDSDVSAVSNSKQRLARLAPPSADLDQISQDWQRRREQQDSFTLPNPANHSGEAEFVLLRIHGQSSAKARWMAGDAALKDFESELAARTPAAPDGVGAIDLLRWGTLSCKKPEAECSFRLASARDAVYAELRSTLKTAATATSPAGQSAASDPRAGVYRVGGGVSAPKATYAPDPQYSKQARAAHFEGTVVLWLIVDADGLPQDIKVERPLGMGLDEEAIKAVEQWRFQPAMKDGKPVPVMINVQMNFWLK